jgi:long-chain acyl-CoA synthetase
MTWQEAEREFSDEVVGDETLARTFERSAERNADRVAQRYKGGVYDRSLVEAGVIDAAPEGDYADLTYGEMRAIVRHLAAGFRELGVDDDTRLAVFAETRMEWAQVDFAALSAGAVVTTVYASSSADGLRYLLEDPGATVVVAENRARLEEVVAVRDDLDHELDAIVTMDDVDVGDLDAAAVDDVYTLGEVHDMGAAAFDEAAHESWLDGVDADDLASLVYTSGTTGKPKGVRLTHAEFRANLTQYYTRLAAKAEGDGNGSGEIDGISPASTTLSFLPLAHAFERLTGHFVPFAAGATVAYAESPGTLREDFGLVRPTVVTSVPRVYETLFDAARGQASGSPVKRRVFEWAVDVGRTHYRTADPGPLLDAKRAVADRLVFSSVREALGGEIDFLVSGGGSLSAELCSLYHAMGLPILEGYGLTETAPVVSVNPPSAPEVGTIGPPVIDTEIAVDTEAVDTEAVDAGAVDTGGSDGGGGDGQPNADEPGAVGELLVRGPQVTDGYWNRPDATREAFTPADALPADAPTAGTSPAERDGDPDESWFRTGDIVRLRPDGYIVFRGRTKRLLVLSTGENVAPEPMEDRFAANEFVEQCCVLGDDRRFVSALIVPNVDRVSAWADDRGIDLPDDREAVCRDERVRERIGTEVDRVNASFESYERIRGFRLVPERFTEANGLLTPTMKKKRRTILDRFADDVEAVYDETGVVGDETGDVGDETGDVGDETGGGE